MMDARDVSHWFDREKDRLRDQQEAETTTMNQRASEAKLRRKLTMESELEALDREIEGIQHRVSSVPPVYLHNRFDLTTKKRMKTQLAGFDSLENFQATGFNHGLLSFGSPGFMLMALLASMALAFQWLQSRFGLDAVGGSENLTTLVTVVLVLLLDIVSFKLLDGVLAGLKNFLDRERHVALLARTIFCASLTGLIGFGFILVQRFLEVSL